MKNQLLSIAESIVIKRRNKIRQKTINELHANTDRRLPYKRRDDYLNTKIEEVLGDFQSYMKQTNRVFDVFAIKKAIRKNKEILEKSAKIEYDRKIKILMERKRSRELLKSQREERSDE